MARQVQGTAKPGKSARGDVRQKRGTILPFAEQDKTACTQETEQGRPILRVRKGYFERLAFTTCKNNAFSGLGYQKLLGKHFWA